MMLLRSFRVISLAFRCLPFLLALLVSPGLSQSVVGKAAPPPDPEGHQVWCGTERGLAERVLARHLRNVEETGAIDSRLGPNDRDLGEIAVLDDDGTLVVSGTTDSFAITQRFYLSHPDYWDFIVIFTNTNTSPEAGFAFELNVKGLVGGIGYENFFGLNSFNNAPDFAFPTTRLGSLLNMNSLIRYSGPENCISGFPGCVTGTEVMGQEAGHMFGSFLQASNADVLGRGEAHWSFFYDTEASVMEGNTWQQAGSNFTTIASFNNLGQMDEYYWGLRAEADVTHPGFVVINPSPAISDSTFPQEGQSFTGTRVDVGITNFVAENGPRVPHAGESPRDFNYAYILVVPQGTDPSQADLDEINAFRTSWETYFSLQTEGLGTADTALTTAEFSADVTEGIGPLTVQFTDASFGNITSRMWDFGDGMSSGAVNPGHLYSAPGRYSVSLTVTSPTATRTTTKTDLIVVGERAPLMDDFEGASSGFAVGDPGDTATGGIWIRRDPNPTFEPATNFVPQPDDDNTPGAGFRAYVTGNALNAGPEDDDVDGGVTSLVSDVFDLDGETSAALVYHRYGYNRDMSSADGLSVDLSNDGGSTWTTIDSTAALSPAWGRRVVDLDGILAFTDQMRLRFQARDDGVDGELEVAIDDVAVLTTAPGPGSTCNLAVLSAVVDFDPSTGVIDPGPGAMGQELDVVLSVRNDGDLPVTSADVSATATLGPLVVTRGATVTDFDAGVGGDQELAPEATTTVRISFEALSLERCGVYSLAAGHDGSALLCRDGAGTVTGDQSPGDDQAPGPPSFLLELGTLTLDVRPESEVVESAASERVKIDTTIQGFTSGLPPVMVEVSFDLVDGNDPDTVLLADARPPHTRTVQTGVSRMTTIRVGVNAMPALPQGVPIRVRITLVDTVTGDACIVALSDPFIITG